MEKPLIKPPVCMATAPAGAAGGRLPAAIAEARRTVCGPEHDWTLQAGVDVEGILTRPFIFCMENHYA